MKILLLVLLLAGTISCGKKSSDSSSSSPKNTPKESKLDPVKEDHRLELEYLKLVNNHRKKLNLGTLAYHEFIEEVSTEHSVYMAGGIGRFGHSGWKNRCQKYYSELRATACAEIVAMGQKTIEDVFEAWLNSPDHRAAIENPRYTHTGLGMAKNKKGVLYWTQMFAEIP